MTQRGREMLRMYMGHILALTGMIVLSLAVSIYVVRQERLRFPWEHETRIYAEFENAQSVTPGQGQTVDVAGVQVGEIGGVKLENGHALVQMNLTSDDLGPVYRNAHLQLRPKTGLNDMAIEMDPGRPDPSLPRAGRLKDGDRLPIANTRPNVNPDQVLAALDTDTRRYLSAFVNAGGPGLDGRGAALRRVLRASQPTLARGRRVAQAVADRREKVKRLVANLRVLAHASASKDRELASLVDASSAVFTTLGHRDADLQAAIERLPGALHATRTALTATRGLAVDAAPALTRLRPLARELAGDLVAARPLLREATPVVRNGLRPLVRETTPLLAELRPSVARLERVTPPLVEVGHVANRAVNELGFNPKGPEEGYLYWLAWYIHDGNSVLSVEDAHGVAWRGLVMFGCSTLGQVLAANPALAPIAALPLCPATPKKAAKSGTPAQLLRASKRGAG
ncbi:MAG: phospholipid/cholesterol/gamma-HCH transport system substrate-binding protein [Thermoleophilaceae bacterium]|nr:phospholipid/cholesterol/gamma-HCH transport system substrate-binding protein [Thermoleophilaceae bacterium]